MLGLLLTAVAACSNDARSESGAAINAVTQSVSETPFRFIKNQVLVEVMINDEGPFTFLVDTGVTPSVIDIDLARQLDFPIDDENAGLAAGAGSNDVQIFPTTMTGLVVAGETLEELPAVAAPITAGLSSKIGEPLHGILGYAFLRSRAVRFDYVDHRLSFAPSASSFEQEISDADFVMPLRFGEGDIMPIADVTIAGETFVASIDTGSSLGLEVFADAVDRLGLAETVSGWERGQITGARGAAEIFNGSLQQATIGPLVFHDISASVGPRRGGDYRDGNIGNEMWDGYVVIFDYVDERVAFIKSVE